MAHGEIEVLHRCGEVPDREAIDIIHKAGGKAVGAHLIRTLDQYNSLPLLADVVDHFVKCGMDGFEVFYGKNNWQQVKSMLELCRTYGLIMTGGSDYHGLEELADVHWEAITCIISSMMKKSFSKYCPDHHTRIWINSIEKFFVL